MKIIIDDKISRSWFFITVPISNDESLSFDRTRKGPRIILHKFLGEKSKPEGEPHLRWDMIYIEDGKFTNREHIEYYYIDKKDWINGRVYENVRKWPLDEQTAKKLLKYSLAVRDNINELDKYSDDMREFEKLLEELINKVYAG